MGNSGSPLLPDYKKSDANTPYPVDTKESDNTKWKPGEEVKPTKNAVPEFH